MESLIGKLVKIYYPFPLDNEVFKIISERATEIEIQGDFSAGTNCILQSEWVKKNLIKKIL